MERPRGVAPHFRPADTTGVQEVGSRWERGDATKCTLHHPHCNPNLYPSLTLKEHLSPVTQLSLCHSTVRHTMLSHTVCLSHISFCLSVM